MLALVVVLCVELVFVLLKLAPVVATTGSGGLGAVSVELSTPVILAVPTAFLAGASWQFRRSRRRAPPPLSAGPAEPPPAPLPPS
jgi:hypothetical protein